MCKDESGDFLQLAEDVRDRGLPYALNQDVPSSSILVEFTSARLSLVIADDQLCRSAPRLIRDDTWGFAGRDHMLSNLIAWATEVASEVAPDASTLHLASFEPNFSIDDAQETLTDIQEWMQLNSARDAHPGADWFMQ